MSAIAVGGLAVGLDLSSRNVVEARRRHGHAGVAFVVADAHALPMATACLDGCRAERTLQHVIDPALVMAEIARTLRPGGRVVLSEPDWDSCTLVGASEAVAESVLAHWIGGRHPNSRVGRNLASLLVESGLEPVGIRCEAVIYRSLDDAELAVPIRRAADHAVAAGVIERRTADAWMIDLAASSAAERFMFSVPLFTAVGVKPL